MNQIFRHQMKEATLLWYYSDSKLAQLSRKTYRALYHSLIKRSPQLSKKLKVKSTKNPPLFIIFDDRKLIYIPIPKSACSSIKATMGCAYDIKEYKNVHGAINGKFGVRKIKAEKRDYYKFSFVRNPFFRLFSCYRDKILRTRQTGKNIFRNNLFTFAPEISFPHFVKKVAQIPDHLSERHYQSQYFLLARDGKLSMDYIGKVENINEDWERLALKYGFEPKLIHKKSSAHLEEGPRDYRLYYTKELAELVYKRYEKDFLYFGYTDAYQDLLDFIEQQKAR